MVKILKIKNKIKIKSSEPVQDQVKIKLVFDNVTLHATHLPQWRVQPHATSSAHNPSVAQQQAHRNKHPALAARLRLRTCRSGVCIRIQAAAHTTLLQHSDNHSN
jgi:peptidase E